jgi:adenylate cyclase
VVVTDAELEQVGLYFPGGPFAEERLGLLRYLVDRGATLADLVAFREELPGLAAVLALRPTGALTLEELVERSGVDTDMAVGIIQAAGFPAPVAGDRVFSPELVEFCRVVPSAIDLFGEDAIFQVVRVMGSTSARLADALVSSFLANVEPTVRNDDPVGLEIARANTLAVSLMPQVVTGFDALLRQHLVALRRSATPDSGGGVETRELGVGFVDLVDSTGLALAVTMGELGVLLTEFENLTADIVVAAGGRVVKLIGDEVLYTAPDRTTTCEIALELAEVMRHHLRLPMVRAGVAYGEVMLRDGDVFGPVVNLAARAAKVGGPGQVVVQSELADASGFESEPLGVLDIRGFGSVGLARLIPRPASSEA